MINNLISMIITATVITSCATYSVVTTNPIEETMIIIQGEYEELIELKIDAGEYSISKVDNGISETLTWKSDDFNYVFLNKYLSDGIQLENFCSYIAFNK